LFFRILTIDYKDFNMQK